MFSVQEAWTRVRAATRPAQAGVATRLANLALTAVLAHKLGLTRTRRGRSLGAAGLRQEMLKLALTPIDGLEDEVENWPELLQVASQAAGLMTTADALDAWANSMQSAHSHRKSLGAYATPTAFARQLVASTLSGLRKKTWDLIDPSAGTGALLMAAVNLKGAQLRPARLRSLVYGLHGVEIDPNARELCCHLLWLRAARARADLARIAANIHCGNAITRDWQFDQPFDALVMNPPWDSLRHASNNESLDVDRDIAIERLGVAATGDPDLPPLFSLQGTGDRNLAKAFLELAPHLISNGGRFGALIPAAFASDLGMSSLRKFYFSRLELRQWTSFENLLGYFPIDGRYKFGLLIGRKSPSGTRSLRIRAFGKQPSDAQDPHFALSRSTIGLIGGHSRMIPEVGSSAELRILTRMFRNGSPLLDHDGPLGRVAYRREFDLTLDRAAGHFFRFEDRRGLELAADGHFAGSEPLLVPLVEGRMVGQFDFFQKSWVRGTGRTAEWEINGVRPLMECTPQYITAARTPHPSRIAICDVTSATNTRTVHATLVPATWGCGNTAPILEFSSVRLAIIAMAVLNSMIFDWQARRLVAGLHLNKFYLNSMVWPCLSAASAERIFGAALSVCAEQPRAIVDSLKPQARTNEVALSRVDALSLIETEVAAGYGLSVNHLKTVYNADTTDRRGFWRYFASEPTSLQVVANATGRRTSAPPPESARTPPNSDTHTETPP
jgi:predicted RNA methylase